MSAECSTCGSDLAYDLSCGRCEQRARAEKAEAREAVLVEALKEMREAGGALYRAASEAENAGAFNAAPLGTSVHWLEALDLYHAVLAGVVEAEPDGSER